MKNNNIKNFVQYYEKVLNSKVLPKIQNFEMERKIINKFCFSCAVFIYPIEFSIFTMLVIKLPDFEFKWLICSILFIIFMCTPWSLRGLLQIDFQNKIKEKIMFYLTKAFQNFYWIDNKNKVITEDEIKEADLFNIQSDISYNNQFLGIYEYITVRIAEVSCPNEFHGVIISMNTIKKFNGTTIITNTPLNPEHDLADNAIKLDNIKFAKLFKIYSTDKKLPGNLLTKAFIEKLKNLQEKFSGSSISCCLKNNNLFIAIPTYKELFSVGRLNIPITDTKQYDELLIKFISVFETIEELKLYENTGL